MGRAKAVGAAAVLVVVDQLAKMAAVQHLVGAGTLVLVPGVFGLTYAENHGAAFGMMQGARWFFIIFTVVVLVGMWKYYGTLPREGRGYGCARLMLVLLAGGAVGNFIDRLVNGFVIDFFHIFGFPIFNFADIFIVTGAAGMSFLLLFVIKEGDEPQTLDS